MFSKSTRGKPPRRSLSIIEQSVTGHPTSPLTMPVLSSILSVTFPDFNIHLFCIPFLAWSGLPQLKPVQPLIWLQRAPQSCHVSMFLMVIKDAPPRRFLSIIEQSVSMTGLGGGHPTSPLTMSALSSILSVTLPD